MGFSGGTIADRVYRVFSEISLCGMWKKGKFEERNFSLTNLFRLPASRAKLFLQREK